MMKIQISLLSLLFMTPALAQTPNAPAFKQYVLKGDDAEAIYVRLKKKEYVQDGKKEVHTKVGQNVVCVLESSGVFGRHKEYQCTFSIRMPSGELHEEYPIGEEDKEGGLKEKKEFSGSYVAIKKDQDDAKVTVRGLEAQEMYQALSAEEKIGIIRNGEITEGESNKDKKGDQNGTSLKLKTATHIRCYTTTDTIAPMWECLITINSTDGKAKPNDSSGGQTQGQ
jgi:hypothetical protein